MSTMHRTGHSSSVHPPVGEAERGRAAEGVVLMSARRWLAVLRIVTGSVFLWAFADKTFGLHYSTAGAKSWLNGGSPTKGFLSHVEVGPFQSLMHSMAGTWWADGLFMAGLLAVGVAAVLGVALRPAALAGTVMMAMMWAAEWPLAQHATGGAPSGSVNPLVDYHVIYALALIVAAATYSGHVWGLGRVWARLPLVRRSHWLV